MKELVSVIIPTYNRGYILEQAIASVQNQTYPEIEILVVDDGSTDNTEQIVSQISDSRIRYIKNPKNCGVSHTRNLGIAAAKGKYIAFQDSDDIWKPDKLEKQMECMRQEDYGMVYCAFQREFQDGSVVYYPPKEMPMEEKQGNIFQSLLRQNLISTQTMLIPKEVLRETGYFNEGMSNLEDYELALRIAKNHKIGMVDEALVYLHTLPDGINQNQIQSLVNITYIYLCNKDAMKRYGMFEGMMGGIREKARELGIEEIIETMMKQNYS